MDVTVKRFGRTNISFRSFIGVAILAGPTTLPDPSPVGGIWHAFVGVATLAVCLALAVGLWAGLMRVLYRVRAAPPRRLTATSDDGWELALFHRPASPRRFQEPVILCHGLCSNHHHFDFEPPYSLAHHLAQAGFECFSVDLRGTRASRRSPPGRSRAHVSVDDHIDHDGPAIIERALRETGASRAFWVGHSLGGLIGYGVAQAPSGRALRGLVALGAPVFFEQRFLLRASLRLGALLSWPRLFRQELFSLCLAPFLGDVTLPLSDVLVNPKHIPPRLQRKLYATLLSNASRRTVLQFQDWATHDAFRSFDATRDFRAGLPALTVPTLVMGGSQDALATSRAVEKQFALLGSEDKTLALLGTDRGDLQEYGHGDLLFGLGAPLEVYPLVSRWLEARASPLPQPEAP